MPEPYPGDLLEHLRAFAALAAAATGRGRAPYDRAAHAINVDPSVLRRRIATLTDFLGVALIAGRGATLAPTAHGDQLLSTAAPMLAVAGELRARVRGARPRVTIGCTEAITAGVMPRVVAALDRAPAAPILAIRRLGTDACCRAIIAGDIDLGVVRGATAPAGVESEALCRDRLWIATARRDPLARRRRLTREALAAAPLVLYGERSQTQHRVMTELRPLGADVRIEVEGRATALEFVRRGAGIAFFSLPPGDAVRMPGVIARDVTALFTATWFWTIWRRGPTPPPAADLVRRALAARLSRPRRDRATG